MLVDPEQIKRAQAGDPEAFQAIVRAYQRRVAGTMVRLVPPAKAEEITSDVFLRLHASLGDIRCPEIFEPWLHRLAVNTAYDYLRKHRHGH